MNLERFNRFLKTVDLHGYRKKYSRIKIVEMDLPKEIQAINLLYKVYWEEKKFLSFEEFYKRYLKEGRGVIEKFRLKVTMCKSCFYRGLDARIYRTWASLITQIHGGYVAELVFGKGSVDMSRELDSMGADIREPYLRFIEDTRTDCLSNGFVVFTKDTFLPKKKEIDLGTI